MEKPLKPIDTIDEQCENRIRRYLTTNPTADADRQQGANGRNLKKNIGTRDQAMEPNVPWAQTEWRMEENIRLQKAKQGT
ncbi:MAG: hypothetical protein EZS28_036073, partial [Streblomastix strix]